MKCYYYLLSNSIKYTIQGGITVSHTLTNTTLITKITDTGIGIPEDSKGLLFKRFFQIGGARQQSSSKGSGLGLYSAKKNVQQWGGRLEIESKVGQGTTVSVLLPLLLADWFKAIPITIGSTSQLIIIDDDPTVHAVWRKKIASQGSLSEEQAVHFESGQKFVKDNISWDQYVDRMRKVMQSK